jgi:hypothetical protein
MKVLSPLNSAMVLTRLTSDMRFKVISKTLVALLLFAHSLLAQAQKARPVDPAPNMARTSQPMLWREPADIKTRDLFYGPGGKDRQPQGKKRRAGHYTLGAPSPLIVTFFQVVGSSRISNARKLR